MSHLLSKPIYINQLSPGWRAFIRHACDVGFGELHDCTVESGDITAVRKVVRTHNGRALISSILIDPAKPLNEKWTYLIALCASGDPRIIPLIKLDAGQPVLFQTEEGGWEFRETE